MKYKVVVGSHYFTTKTLVKAVNVAYSYANVGDEVEVIDTETQNRAAWFKRIQ